MSPDDQTRYPDYLRPVASAGDSAALELEPVDDHLSTGLTPPSGVGRPGMFTTDLIVALGFAPEEVVANAVQQARDLARTPESLLVEWNAISTDQLARAVAERYGLDHVDLGVYRVDMGAASTISAEAARRYQAVPVGFVDSETLLVAVADPANVLAIDDIRMLTGLSCKVAIAAPDDIESQIKGLSSLAGAVSESIAEEEDYDELGDISELRESADDAPIVKLVYSILGQATTDGASDIHFEPGEGEMRVRFRVDGVLSEAAHVPRRMIAGVISRIKIMAELDIAEKRLPQDGRVSVDVEGRRVDLRVTTLPTQRGEGATIRILDKSKAMLSLEEMGFEDHARMRFSEAFNQAYGAVLVTGPTGSGKSTSLYAAINEINSVERKIITIEDPVEYRVDGVTQMNVNRKAGLTFAAGLRSMLRADPDVIMVGEIRDAETARIAIESALTGHLVLSTLHTNDAPGAVVRLSEMGVESFLIAASVDCVVAQRLARKLCSSCKSRVVRSGADLARAGFPAAADIECYEAVGCGRCGNSGYRGRLGLYSVMRVTEGIRECIVNGASAAEISTLARADGMETVREDGLNKVRAGLTSIEEVARVST